MGTLTYNTTTANCGYVFTTTNGGTTFSGNLVGTAVWDYFNDSPTVNDAIYFSGSSGSYPFADILLNVGTAMAGTDIVLKWEFYHYTSDTWVDIVDLSDDTTSLTTTGANRVKFPFQMQHLIKTVNGTARQWVRCRLHSFTAVTEGGANQTTAAKSGNGRVDFSGYTEEAPANFTEIYDYIKANYSYISIIKNLNYFDFRKLSIYCSGADEWLESHGETILLGVTDDLNLNSAQVKQPRWYLYRFTSGNLVGTTRGRNGSTFILNAVANSHPIYFSVAKCYGMTLRCGPNCPYVAGYPPLAGEFVDCLFEMRPAFSSATASFINCKFALQGGIITTIAPATFSGCSAIINSDFMFLYQGSFEMPGFDYEWHDASGNRICYINNNSVDSVWTFLNLGTPLPGEAEANYPIYMGDRDVLGWSTVFYYDDSAGTYTDYTTEANDASADDFPVGGDADDYYYFRQASKYILGMKIEIETNLASNDHVYVWEYFHDGWTEFAKVVDHTANLTTVGHHLWLMRKTNTFYLTSTTINGIAGYWIRMKVVSGTGNPMISRMRGRSMGGITDWRMYEKYSLDLKVVDEDNNAINGASVKITDSNDTLVTDTTTNASGEITQQKLIRKYLYFDPPNAVRTVVAEVTMGDFTLTIQYAGKKDFKNVFTLNKQIDWTIALKLENIIVDMENVN